jgi:[protein-PII] uridylyltransferase
VAQLIQTLYRASLEVLGNTTVLNTTARRLKRVETLRRSSVFSSLPSAIQKRILTIPSNAFFIRHTAAEIIAIGEAAYRTAALDYRMTNTPHFQLEIIRRGSIDIAYLLVKLSRINVVGMEIIKLFDDLKYFKIDFDESLAEEDFPEITTHIQAAFSGHTPIQYQQPHINLNEIKIDCNHTREYATLRLRTRNQKGLLAYVIHRFDHHGIDIASTKIHTIKGRVNDLFLIEKNGNFCHNIENLIAELTE